jgi:aryl-alcohol dehydrogenase-like predicted oxidoreductase
MQYKIWGTRGYWSRVFASKTMAFSGGSGIYKHIGKVDQAGADELVKASIDAGINFFDTAALYSSGESETTLGQSFKNLGTSIPNIAFNGVLRSRCPPPGDSAQISTASFETPDHP